MLTTPSSWGVGICQAQLGFESRDLCGSKGLGEYVSNLHGRSNGQQFEETIVKFFHQRGDNQFLCAWCVHERLDWMLFEGQICCHSTGLQAGREENVNPEGGKTTIVAHMWWWQGLYT